MGPVGRKGAAAVLLVVAAACASASASVVTLASYAAGTWNCTMTVTAGGQTVTLKPRGVVTASSATTGTVTVTVAFPETPGRVKYAGQWSLQSDELMVKWDKHEQGTLQAQPISLDTKQFKVRSGLPGDAKWSKVTVDRKARSVTFGFDLVAGSEPHTTMTCRKA